MLFRPLQYTAVSAYTQQTPLRKVGSQLLFPHARGGAGSCGNERGQLWALGCVLQRLLRIHGKDGDGSRFLRLLSVPSHSWDLLSWADLSLRPARLRPCTSPGCTRGRGHLCSGGPTASPWKPGPSWPSVHPAFAQLPASSLLRWLSRTCQFLKSFSCLLLPPKTLFPLHSEYWLTAPEGEPLILIC